MYWCFHRSSLFSDIEEKAMAIHSSTLAWKIPWMEELGRLQSMGSLRVRHNWATSLSLFTFMHWRRKWQPTAVFLPGESQGRGSLVSCLLWGRTVGHDWTNLAAAAAGADRERALFGLIRGSFTSDVDMLEEEGSERGPMPRQLVLWNCLSGLKYQHLLITGKERSGWDHRGGHRLRLIGGGNPGASGRAEGLKEEEEQEQGLVMTIP